MDRRKTLIAGVGEGALPRRRMTIAGMEGGLDARILSKDMSGPATRVVDFPAGWGSGIPGAFTADIELLVLRGDVGVGEHLLGARDYVAIAAGGVVPSIRARSAGRALLMTAAPLRYDTASGGAPARIVVARHNDLEWEPVPGPEGRFMKRLRTGGSGEAWLGGALEWSHAGPWHRHDAAEECYVIDGSITFSELEQTGPVSYTYGQGGYVWRPPGSVHVGPGSGAPDTALTFHRAPAGSFETEWIDDDPGEPPE
jgi:hypothetical protein